MATVSYLLTSNTQGTTFNLGSLTDGLMKFSITGGHAVPATAVASTTGADNDYMGGSAKLSNIASLPALAGSMIIGTGDLNYWIELPVAGAGSVMFLNQTSPSANIVPAWISPGTVGQVLTVIGNTVGSPRLGWTTGSTGSVTSVAVSSSDLTVGGSPITTSGTITLALNTVSIAKGGTGQVTALAGFNALSPLTTTGDLLLFTGGNNTRLPIGAAGRVLTSDGTTASWSALPGTGTVTSVAVSSTGGTIAFTGSPITTSGTINLDINTVAIAKGGTGQVTASAAFNALSPITSVGDLILGTGVNTASRLAVGGAGTVLTSNGTTASWTAPATAGTVTSVAATSADITITGSPITTSGTLNFTLNTVSIAKGGTGQVTSILGFNALSPTTTKGDIIWNDGTNNARLAVGTIGQVLSVAGASALQWVDAGDASDWSTFPAVQNVDMGGFSVEDASGVFARLVNITGTADAISPDFGTGSLSVDVDPNNYLHYTSQTIATNIVVTASPTGYATVGSLLLGNLVDYDALAIGTVGQVLTSDGTTASWEDAAGGAGTVTSVTLASPNTNSILSGTNPITTSGTITIDVGAPVLWDIAAGTFSIGPKDFGTGTHSDCYVINGIGFPSLTGNANGSTAYGRNALSSIVDSGGGQANSSFGAFALQSCDTGGLNVAVGYLALGGLTSGLLNTGVGFGAGYDLITQNSMTCIGQNTLIGLQGFGGNCTALGRSAGLVNVQTLTGSFNNNTFLGAFSSIDEVSLTANNRTAVGANVKVGNDNMVQLGNQCAAALDLFGSSAPAALRNTGNANGYAAISVINPGAQYQLWVTGRTGITGFDGRIPLVDTNTTNATGTLLLGNGLNYTALAIGTTGQVLTSDGTTAAWGNPATSGTVTSVAVSSTGGTIAFTGSPITSAGTINLDINTVTTAKGGTGQTTYAPGDTLYYSAGTVLSKLAVGAANTVMTSSGAAPQWVGGVATSGQVLTYNGANVVWAAPATAGTVTSVGLIQGASDFTISGSPVTTSGSLSITLNTVGIAKGGTGQTTALAGFNALSPLTTTGDLLLFTGGNNTRLAIGASGTVLSSNGTTASWAPAGAAALTWVSVAGTSQTIAASRAYIAKNVAQTTFTLPATASVGDTYRVFAFTPAGWTVVPGTATQVIVFGNTITTPTTGSLTSTSIGDVVEITCLDNTVPGSEIFGVSIGPVGNLTVA